MALPEPKNLDLGSVSVAYREIGAGEHDRGAGGDDCRAIAEAIPGARYEVIAGVGHVPHFEAPDVVNRLLGEFLLAEI